MVSIPAFRQTVTTTYCKETHKHQERKGTQTKKDEEIGDCISKLATVETINTNVVQQTQQRLLKYLRPPLAPLYKRTDRVATKFPCKNARHHFTEVIVLDIPLKNIKVHREFVAKEGNKSRTQRKENANRGNKRNGLVQKKTGTQVHRKRNGSKTGRK